MRTLTLLAAAGVTTMILSGGNAIAAGGQQQPPYSQFHKPMAPIGPTSAAQCDALESEWAALCTRITDTHQQCLDASTNPNIKGAGACSKAPCLSLHIQMDECNGAERRQAVAACRAAVKVHTDREAEFKRMQDAAIRAQQQMERERRERFKAEAAKSNLEAERQRRVAEEYRRNTPKGPVRTEMSDRQAARMAALQQQAAAAAQENRRAVSLPRDHDFVGNNTLPELTDKAALIGKLGKMLGRTDVQKGAEVAQWFTEIHDARRAAAENARVDLNDSLRRDFPNERTFTFDTCRGGEHLAECRQFFTDLSPESDEKWKQYNWAMNRYVAWSDLGNVSGRGWTQQEQAKFLSKVGDSTVKQIGKWLSEEAAKNPSWEKVLKNPVQDRVNADLKKRINEHIDNALKQAPQPSPTPVPPPSNSLWSEEAANEYNRLLKAYVDELRRRENQRFLEELARELPAVRVNLPEIPAGPPVVVSPRR